MMSDALKLGDVVRYRLNNLAMTVSDPGPIKMGGAMGVTGNMVIPQKLSNDHVECIFFDKDGRYRKIFKKTDLDYVGSTEMYHPKEGDLVALASGGPRMLVYRCGAKDFSVAIAVGTQIRRNQGEIRHDLVGCKW